MLNRAIPPHALLDLALFSGDQSAWFHSLRLMKSIILVCRSWYKVGAIFLYQHICIRRFPQPECLRETLYTSKPRNLGALVKSLDIQYYIPEEFTPKFAETLCAIMELLSIPLKFWIWIQFTFHTLSFCTSDQVSEVPSNTPSVAPYCVLYRPCLNLASSSRSSARLRCQDILQVFKGAAESFWFFISS